MVWLTNANNFHVEHHLLPNLPFSCLPRVHEELRTACHFYSRSYTAFFLALLRGATGSAW
jgi:fatty acid desaturase